MILEEPVRGVFTYAQYPGILGLPGFEQMRRFQRRELPYGPLWYLTGLELVEFDVGTATYRLPCTGWLRSPSGVIPGGVLAFAADAALASSVYATLDPGRILATSDLSLNFLRPLAADCEAVVVRASLVEKGSTQGLSEAVLADSAGHLLAHGTARCVISEVSGVLPDPPVGRIRWPEYSGPNPHQRSPEGTILPQEVWDSWTGIDMLRAWQAGRLPRSPLSNLIAAKVEHVEEGSVTCTMPASRWLCGMGGTLYGGALALLADYAIHGAVQSLLPAGTAWATLDLKTRFLRPVAPDDRSLAARARVVHRGRRIVVAAVEISTADGKLTGLADASIMLLPHRRWAGLPAFTSVPHDVGAVALGT